VLESGVARQVEEIVEIEGGRRWYETYKSPVAIDGRIIGTVGFARDITERKEAERNLKMAVEVTQVILWKVDFPSQKLSFDPAMLPVLGPGSRRVVRRHAGLDPARASRRHEAVHAAIPDGTAAR
jgi:hypothetical protein